MLEGESPLSDWSASSRKSEEVITDEPHAGKLARVVLAGLSRVLGLCLDLPCAKSKGLVPMEIPLGPIPHLMTKGELAWRKVKIGGVEKNSLLGYSEGPKGSNAQLLTPPGIALSEPSQEWPLVDTHLHCGLAIPDGQVRQANHAYYVKPSLNGNENLRTSNYLNLRRIRKQRLLSAVVAARILKLSVQLTIRRDPASLRLTDCLPFAQLRKSLWRPTKKGTTLMLHAISWNLLRYKSDG
ncbi:hypothetical protein Tco_0947234 [Tanacetum coccineum]